jgi:hypothetical protein
MPLLGSAAMLLCFDVQADAVAEHDEWHTHEHLPERLSIPGFLRGTRWVASQGTPRYVVLYEVERLETLASSAYLERLNHPTPWTQRMMPHYRGMTRGLCAVRGSRGFGTGHAALVIRFDAPGGGASSLAEWLGGELLPGLPARRGLGSAHWLEAALPAKMTNEQRIRGVDAGIGSALLVTGYDERALAELAHGELSPARLEARGASAIVASLHRQDYTLAAAEISH